MKDYIFSSGLKFNKTEEEVDINGEKGKLHYTVCFIFRSKIAIKKLETKLNHLKPNCKSFQKIKNVLNKNCKGAYQGKIFVKDIAQKTDAYQLK